MITIRPQAGLGNRLRALDSAVHLSKMLQMPLQIEWVRNKDCNCAFADLFELIKNFRVVEKYSIIRDDGKIERSLNPFRKLLYNMRMPSASSIFFNRDIVQMKNNKDLSSEFQDLKNIYIQTETSFIKGKEPFSFLKPTLFIEEKKDKLTAQYNENTIGVHIRRSDNVNAVNSSPTALFITKMQEEIDINGNTNFFLATDSEKEENKLRGLFKEKIITYKKRSYNRNSKEAIQDAWIDMLCLSGTKKIFGSYYSSFSEIASEIGRIPLEIVQK